jgi:hypothetical protein
MNNRQFFATLVVGALFGASVLLTMRGHDLDLLYLKIETCKTEKEQLLEDRAKLIDELSHAQKKNIRRLKKINIVVNTAPDEFTKLHIQKELKNQLKMLIDKELSLLEEEPGLIKNLVEDKTFELPGNQNVTVQIPTLIIGETTTLYIKVIKAEETLKHPLER